MRPFSAGETAYERSIALDGSTVGDITVTVAVSTSRSDELDVLESIYRATEDLPFFPFRDKSRNLDRTDHSSVSEELIAVNHDRLSAIAHVADDGSDQQRIEAVQSAVLVGDLDLDETLVILDGDRPKAKRFGHAIGGISESRPPTVTCIKSEFYYPTCLLADLCANYLAYEIEGPTDCNDVALPVHVDKRHQNWGSAYAEMVNATGSVQIEPIERRQADTVPQRVNCWFNGTMGGGDPVQFGGSVQPIANHAENEGYGELARWLSEI